MKKIILLSLLALLFVNYHSYSQDLRGTHILRINNQTYYVNFHDISYDLFSLKENPTPGKHIDNVIAEMGYGRYELTNDSIKLYFDSTRQRSTDYSSDSLSCFMSTNLQSHTVHISIQLNYKIKEYGNSGLIIETYSRNYFYPIKNKNLSVSFPDSIRIKKIKLGVMGYDERLLPYDGNFNTFNYIYYFNEKSSYITFIIAKTWSFPIKFDKSKNIIRVGNTGYLTKADEKTINYLKELAGKDPQVQLAVHDWFNK